MSEPPSLSTESLILVLHKLVDQGLVSIEIIPGGLGDWIATEVPNPPRPDFPFLLVGGNLGIPKKVLQSLYLGSVKFPRIRSSGQTGTTTQFSPSSFSLDESSVFSTLAQTTVIIIMNPAHQTALNARKKLILQGKHGALIELRFTELLVHSVKACAKESALWDHRRWCMKHLFGVITYDSNRTSIGCPNYSLQTTTDAVANYVPDLPASLEIYSLPKLPLSMIRDEFSAIRQACSIYPRNYHAWTHWRFIFDICCTQLLSSPCLYETDKRGLFRTLIDEYNQVRHWIDGHISDFSGMHHLAGARRWIDHFTATAHPSFDSIDDAEDLASLAEHALAVLTAYPSHESLWMFLRILLGQMDGEKRDLFIFRVEQLHPYDEKFKRQLILRFASTYGAVSVEP